MAMLLGLVFSVFLATYVQEVRGGVSYGYGQPCDNGAITVQEFNYQPNTVLSPGYVYYTFKATVRDSDTAQALARGDLQMTIELLCPQHGVVPMPCEGGVGSCTKRLSEYAPYLAQILSQGQTEIWVDNKQFCLFDTSLFGSIYSSGQYRITARFLESGRTLSCLRFETYVQHSQNQCQ